jgi:hypothetical protein
MIVRCFAPLGEYHIGANQIMLAQIGADRRRSAQIGSDLLPAASEPTAGLPPEEIFDKGGGSQDEHHDNKGRN